MSNSEKNEKQANTNNTATEKRRYFSSSSDKYKNIREVMQRIGQGEPAAKEEFLTLTKEFCDTLSKSVAAKVFGGSHDQEEVIKEQVQEVLIQLVLDPSDKVKESLFSGKQDSWKRFTISFCIKLESALKKEKSGQQQERGAIQKFAEWDPSLNQTPEEKIIDKEGYDTLHKALLRIEERRPRSGEIIRKRFAVDKPDGDDRVSQKTLKEISKDFDIPVERVRQMQNIVLRSLRHPNIAGDLKTYYKEGSFSR